MSTPEGLTAHLAKIIWEASRADEGTISATGANVIAEAVLAALRAAGGQEKPNDLAARLHSAFQYQWDQCDHGTYIGGPSNGEPYAMCERIAEHVLRAAPVGGQANEETNDTEAQPCPECGHEWVEDHDAAGCGRYPCFCRRAGGTEFAGLPVGGQAEPSDDRTAQLRRQMGPSPDATRWPTAEEWREWYLSLPADRQLRESRRAIADARVAFEAESRPAAAVSGERAQQGDGHGLNALCIIDGCNTDHGTRA